MSALLIAPIANQTDHDLSDPFTCCCTCDIVANPYIRRDDS